MRERLSLLLIRLATWSLDLATRTAPDGSAVILAVAHGDGHWSRLWHVGTPAQALEVAGEARHQAWHAERRGKKISARFPRRH